MNTGKNNNQAAQTVTRFAPSPTGFLHIGGVRTALFNWLYAHHNKGKMLLRIEDTDRVRSQEEAVEAIIQGMQWLGLQWDGEIVYQHKNIHRHLAVAHQLLDKGYAYKCYCTEEELDKIRLANKQSPHAIPIKSPWREKNTPIPSDRKPCIRFKSPLEGTTHIDDTIQGDVTIPNRTLEDLILVRSNDTPTYMLSVVVDDHDMQISHVIRGDDHLTNTAKQILLYQALNWSIPRFSHIPLIHGQDGQKLSKRHAALDINAYKDMGYLPDALCNYLVRLGWSHGDKEYFTKQDMIDLFTLENVGKAPARMDMDKLNATNSVHLKSMSDEMLFNTVMDFAYHTGNKAFHDITHAQKEAIIFLLPEIRKRSHTLAEIISISHFLCDDKKCAITDETRSFYTSENKNLLNSLARSLESISDWQVHTLKSCFQTFITDNNLSLPLVAKPMRVALTGMSGALSIYDICFALGKEETLRRLYQW